MPLEQDIGTMIGHLNADISHYLKGLRHAASETEKTTKEIEAKSKSLVPDYLKETGGGGEKGGLFNKLLGGNAVEMLGKVTIITHAVHSIMELSKVIYENNSAIQAFDKSVETSKQVQEKYVKVIEERRKAQIGLMQGLAAGDRTVAFATEQENARKNIEGINEALVRAKKVAEESAPTWRSLWQAGAKVHEVDLQNVKDLEDQKAAAEDYARQLDSLNRKKNEANAMSLASKWEEEAKTAGLAAEDVEIYRMRLEGVAPSLIRAAELAAAHKKAMTEQAQVAKEARESFNSLVKSLEGEMTSLLPGMEGAAGRVEQFIKQHKDLTQQQISDLHAWVRGINQAKAAQDAKKEADKQAADEQRQADEIVKNSLTPQQKYAEQLQLILKLVDHNKLSTQDAAQAIDKAGQEMLKATDKAKEFKASLSMDEDYTHKQNTFLNKLREQQESIVQGHKLFEANRALTQPGRKALNDLVTQNKRKQAEEAERIAGFPRDDKQLPVLNRIAAATETVANKPTPEMQAANFN